MRPLPLGRPGAGRRRCPRPARAAGRARRSAPAREPPSIRPTRPAARVRAAPTARAERSSDRRRRHTCATDARRRGCGTPAASRRPTCCKLRAGDASDAPDAVVLPGTHDEVVARARAAAREHRVAVVPFAGGTSVVGGLVAARDGLRRCGRARRRPPRPRWSTSTRSRAPRRSRPGCAAPRPRRCWPSTASRSATSRSPTRTPASAATPRPARPGSPRPATAASTRWSSASALATPRGTLRLGTAPTIAAGPDLRQLVLGSEGAFGVITVGHGADPAPSRRCACTRAGASTSFADGAAALRALAQDGPLPDRAAAVRRGRDRDQPRRPDRDRRPAPRRLPGDRRLRGHRGRGRRAPGGRAPRVLDRRRRRRRSAPSPGEAWRAGRYRAPYLRDPLLDAGVLVETLETATFWSQPDRAAHRGDDRAHRRAQRAGHSAGGALPHLARLRDRRLAVLHRRCARRPTTRSRSGRRPRRAANAAIRAAGATITHHHGVGTDHRAT